MRICDTYKTHTHTHAHTVVSSRTRYMGCGYQTCSPLNINATYTIPNAYYVICDFYYAYDFSGAIFTFKSINFPRCSSNTCPSDRNTCSASQLCTGCPAADYEQCEVS